MRQAIESYAFQLADVEFAELLSSEADLLIIESYLTSRIAAGEAMTNSETLQLQANGKTLIGYVNVSTTDAARDYWTSDPSNPWVLSANPTDTNFQDVGTINPDQAAGVPSWLRANYGMIDFNGGGNDSYIVDYADPAWLIVLKDQIRTIMEAGFDGIFLDDVIQYFEAALRSPVGESQARANEMMNLVIELARYARTFNEDAYIVVNNGIFVGNDATGGVASPAFTAYEQAIDGILVENLFANETDSNPLNDFISRALEWYTSTHVMLLEDASLGADPATLLDFVRDRGALVHVADTQAYNTLADALFLGTIGDDVIQGTGGPNIIGGGAGGDVIDGGAGADMLDGGTGYDYASYRSAEAAITASLLFASSNTGDAAGDIYAGIEALIGSNFNDGLIGDNADNGLFGGAGFDYLAGGLGHDYIDGGLDWDFIEAGDGFDFVTGGDGNDTWSAVSAVMGATVYLYETANQVLNDGFGNNESLASIEGLFGSQFGDVFVGSNNADTLSGWLGNDVIFGAGGNDVITGGPGSDYIDPGEGFDFIVWDQADFVAGEYDALAGFSSSATSYDTLYFTGLTRSDLSIIDYQGDVFISTQALNFAGAIVVQGATVSQVEAQLLFA